MKKTNRICAAVFSIIIAFSSVSTVYTADASAPVEKFDSRLGLYTETFASGRQFVSTVPNNGVTYDAVILDLPQGATTQLRCDGNLVSFADDEPIYKTGYYTLNISSADIMSGENTETLFVFRIMGTPAANTYNSKFGCPEALCVPTVTEDSERNDMYVYTFPNYKRFYSSVSEDGETVQSASFDFPPNVGYELYKNGKPASFERNKGVTQPGAYKLNVYAKNYGVAEGFEAVYKAVLTFNIGSAGSSGIGSTISSAISSAASAINSGAGSLSSAANSIGSTASSIGSAVSSGSSAVSSASSAVNSALGGGSSSQSSVEAEKDELTETYNDDAKIYKEEFSSGDSFYTNTSNGDITGGNVYIDMPANMSVAMTKDGMTASFANKTYMNDPGSYTLIVTDNFGTRKLSAKYSFRIQQGLDASERTELEAEDEDEEEGGNPSFDFDEGELVRTNADYSFDTDRELFAYPIGDKTVYMNVPPGMFSNDGLLLHIPDGVTVAAVNGDGEEYEIGENGEINENGTYTVNLSDGKGNNASLEFYLYNRAVNMPEDYTAPAGYLITNIAYMNGDESYSEEEEEEETEEETETSEEDEEIELSDDAEAETETEAAEEEEEEKTPEELALEEEHRKGIQVISDLVDMAARNGIASMTLPLDGDYSLVMEGENGLPTLTCDIIVDRTAPVLEFEGLNDKMVSTGNDFTLSCSDDDVTIILYKDKEDGEILSEAGGTYTVSGVGRYNIVARDLAGNESTYNVRISRHIGAAGVATIILLIVLIGAIVGFIFYNSRKFSVR